MVGQGGHHVDGAVQVGLYFLLTFCQSVNFFAYVINLFDQDANLFTESANPIAEDVDFRMKATQVVDPFGQDANSFADGADPIAEDVNFRMKAAQVVNLFSEGVNLRIESTEIEDASEYPDNYRSADAGGGYDDASQDKRSVHKSSPLVQGTPTEPLTATTACH